VSWFESTHVTDDPEVAAVVRQSVMMWRNFPAS
jgi:hypothetical protein